MAMDQEAWHNITDQMARQSEENAPVPTSLVKGRYMRAVFSQSHL